MTIFMKIFMTFSSRTAINRLMQMYILITYFTSSLLRIFLRLRRNLLHQMAIWTHDMVSLLIHILGYISLMRNILNVNIRTDKVIFHFDDAFGAIGVIVMGTLTKNLRMLVWNNFARRNLCRSSFCEVCIEDGVHFGPAFIV